MRSLTPGTGPVLTVFLALSQAMGVRISYKFQLTKAVNILDVEVKIKKWTLHVPHMRVIRGEPGSF